MMDEIIAQIDAIIAMHENGEAAGVKLHLYKLRKELVKLANYPPVEIIREP